MTDGISDDPSTPRGRKVSDGDFTVGSALAAIGRSFFLVLLLTAAGGGFGYYVSTLINDKYEATASLILDTELAGMLSGEASVSDRFDYQAAAATAVETINSRVVLRKAFDNLNISTIAALADEGGIEERLEAQISMPASGDPETFVAPRPEEIERLRQQELVEYLSRNLTVRNNGRSFLIEIVYNAEDPDVSSQVANAVASSYLDYRLTIRRAVYQQILDGIDEEIGQLKSELMDAERRAQIMREQVRITAARTEVLTGQQREDAIAAGADLYARQREAERAADSAAEVFERLLLNGRNIQTRLGVPDLDVQLFSEAVPAIRPSGVDVRPIVILLGGVVGFLIGCSVAVGRRRRRV